MNRAIMTLLYDCYTWGISDAAEVSDASLCEEFIAKTREPGVFGRVKDDYTVKWKEWTLMLLLQARLRVFNNVMGEYFRMMGKFGSNYLSTLLVAAQEMYNQGLNDYNAVPERGRIGAFLSEKNKRWGIQLKNWHPRSMTEDIQMALFKRMHEEEESGYKPIVKEKQYMNFISALAISFEQRSTSKRTW